METTIEFNGKCIDVYLNDEGRITIDLNNMETDELPVINVIDGGIPGVIGPDVSYDMKKIHEQELERAQDVAYRGSWDE